MCQAHRHPTQKPVPLLEWLIRTYTNPGDLVLDFCFGSGSTAIGLHQYGPAGSWDARRIGRSSAARSCGSKPILPASEAHAWRKPRRQPASPSLIRRRSASGNATRNASVNRERPARRSPSRPVPTRAGAHAAGEGRRRLAAVLLPRRFLVRLHAATNRHDRGDRKENQGERR